MQHSVQISFEVCEENQKSNPITYETLSNPTGTSFHPSFLALALLDALEAPGLQQ